MKTGDLFLARVVQRDGLNEFILDVTPIPAAQKDDLVAFAQTKYRLYQDAHFNARWADFLRDSSFLFNHFLLDHSGEAATATGKGKVILPTARAMQTAATVASIQATTAG